MNQKLKKARAYFRVAAKFEKEANSLRAKQYRDRAERLVNENIRTKEAFVKAALNALKPLDRKG